jgi:hypothetical protein
MYSVGGQIAGLSAGDTLTIEDNGFDDVVATANGPFTFPTQIGSNGTYDVTIVAAPSGKTCSVANPSGVVTNANVSNVDVSCGSVSAGSPVTVNVSTNESCAAGSVQVMDSASGATQFATAASQTLSLETVPSGTPYDITATCQDGNMSSCTLSIPDPPAAVGDGGSFSTGPGPMTTESGTISGPLTVNANCCCIVAVSVSVQSFCGPPLRVSDTTTGAQTTSFSSQGSYSLENVVPGAVIQPEPTDNCGFGAGPGLSSGPNGTFIVQGNGPATLNAFCCAG